MIVTGYEKKDVVKAAKVLTEFRKYDLIGNVVMVKGDLTQIITEPMVPAINERKKVIMWGNIKKLY